MADKLMVITATSVHDTGEVSFGFVIDSNVFYKDMKPFFGFWGVVRLEEKGEDEIDPFKLVRGQPGAIGPNGIKRWRVYVFKSGQGQFQFASVDEGPLDEDPLDERGLRSIIEDLPRCALLIERELFDRFEAACERVGTQLTVHHFDGELSTS